VQLKVKTKVKTKVKVKMKRADLFWRWIFPAMLSSSTAAAAVQVMFSVPEDAALYRRCILIGGIMVAVGLLVYVLALFLARTAYVDFPRPPEPVLVKTPLFSSIGTIFFGLGAPVILTGMSFSVLHPPSYTAGAPWNTYVLLFIVPMALLFPLAATQGIQEIFWKNSGLVIGEHTLSMVGACAFRLTWNEIEDLHFTRQIYRRSTIPAVVIRVSEQEAHRLRKFRIRGDYRIESNPCKGNLVLALGGYSIYPDKLFQAIHLRWCLAKNNVITE
jgi:hypothetical protein